MKQINYHHFKFTNFEATNPIYKIGVSDPTGGFDFETKWKESNFKEMGVIWANVLPHRC